MAILTTSLTSVSTVTEMDVHAKGHIFYMICCFLFLRLLGLQSGSTQSAFIALGQAWINFIIDRSIESTLLLPKLQGLCSFFICDSNSLMSPSTASSILHIL
jgi:hypothetical protein